MTEFELNIGLFVRKPDAVDETYANTWQEVSDRALAVEARIRGQMTCKVRRHWGEEPTLVVGGVANNVENLRVFVENLCDEFEQDCIAIYFPHLGKGHLVGPNAAAWGDFQLDLFERYFTN